MFIKGTLTGMYAWIAAGGLHCPTCQPRGGKHRHPGVDRNSTHPAGGDGHPNNRRYHYSYRSRQLHRPQPGPRVTFYPPL